MTYERTSNGPALPTTSTVLASRSLSTDTCHHQRRPHRGYASIAFMKGKISEKQKWMTNKPPPQRPARLNPTSFERRACRNVVLQVWTLSARGGDDSPLLSRGPPKFRKRINIRETPRRCGGTK